MTNSVILPYQKSLYDENPNRMCDLAMRTNRVLVTGLSLWTTVALPIRHNDRVVGIPKPASASLPRYSRMADPKGQRPSRVHE